MSNLSRCAPPDARCVRGEGRKRTQETQDTDSVTTLSPDGQNNSSIHDRIVFVPRSGPSSPRRGWIGGDQRFPAVFREAGLLFAGVGVFILTA